MYSVAVGNDRCYINWGWKITVVIVTGGGR